jgi:hypothetical protein
MIRAKTGEDICSVQGAATPDFPKMASLSEFSAFFEYVSCGCHTVANISPAIRMWCGKILIIFLRKIIVPG